MILSGLFLAVAGARLVTLGGSWFYLPMGLATLAAGVLLWRGKPAGALLFGAAFVVALIWAPLDAGWNFWPLVSRLFVFGVLALLAALVYPGLRRAAGLPSGKVAYGLGALIAVCLGITAVNFFLPKSVIEADVIAKVTPVAPGAAQKDWMHWGNTTAGNRFAALDQINKDNVGGLTLAWTAHTGDVPQSNGSGAEDQNTPLQVGDTLYVCTAYGKVVALDADTGAQRWKYDPQGTAPNWQRCRGLGYHDDDAAVSAAQPLPATAAANPAPAACRKRILLPTIDARLIALDAASGQPCAGFGQQGVVDLKTGMGEIKPGYYQQTSTPLVAGDLVVVGGRVADNFSTGEPPGVVRAFDVHTGELAWAWDPGNPAITKLPPAGQTYTRGTPNVWSAMSYDAPLGLIYLPTGNATPDFFGGTRTALDDKYSSSIVAVEAKTGKVRWHFQTTHHDLWDFDLPAQPLLYDIPDGKGGTLPALAQVTKQGEIFLLNRVTGEPIAQVEERKVPQGNVPGERYSPTQPFSVGMPSIGNATL